MLGAIYDIYTKDHWIHRDRCRCSTELSVGRLCVLSVWLWQCVLPLCSSTPNSTARGQGFLSSRPSSPLFFSLRAGIFHSRQVERLITFRAKHLPIKDPVGLQAVQLSQNEAVLLTDRYNYCEITSTINDLSHNWIVAVNYNGRAVPPCRRVTHSVRGNTLWDRSRTLGSQLDRIFSGWQPKSHTMLHMLQRSKDKGNTILRTQFTYFFALPIVRSIITLELYRYKATDRTLSLETLLAECLYVNTISDCLSATSLCLGHIIAAVH
ncbi:hypothetical protein J6590_055997 [Homalodisca vitripennis]|nr:hypothetical protein J6590_055997 [Homalodisca vitripennis]